MIGVIMMDKKYDHLIVEKDKYSYWLDNNYFKSGDVSKTPFCIVIPPPNVTGKLHLGHAWDTTLQDIVIRYKRMQGYDALWLPGMDHAGVATQAKIDKRLRDSNIEPRSLERSKWLEYAWGWKEEYASLIRGQWAQLGLSLDYSKERFTFDEGLNKAVNKVFIDLYNKGLIYKGVKPINWDPIAKTALSNIEVIYKKEHGHMYYLKYMIEGTTDYIEVATTRTETLASDTAVVVHPDDTRYKDLVGKKVITPLRKEAVPVITDSYIDMSFGTGAMKCSAHAVEDFEILTKNNIEVRESINPDGLLNENALEFCGMDRQTARIKIAEKLQSEGLITKIEDYTHDVGHSERTDAVVEIMVMPQWFVNMEPLAKQLLEYQKDKSNKVNFVPKRFEKILTNWMSTIQDWCISRQVWWGHRIPAWYKDDEMKVCVECPGVGWIQDEDVLDTWFSSALWPFSTLGWPDNTDDLKRYFPTNLLVTGYDIIFFWVSRMFFQSLEFTNDKPFKEVLIHGLIRDKDGKKMSKSLSNGIDPMDVIEKYGADSLRYFLTTNTAPGMDLRFDDEKIKSTWNFINKIWNASRYVIMNSNDEDKELTIVDSWILTKLNMTIKNVTKYMDKYEFQNVSTELYNFIWNDFCDWYIEFSKVNSNSKVLKQVLESILKMLHPFMPFVTEEIYSKLTNVSIMISQYPVYNVQEVDTDDYNIIEGLKEYITRVRNVRAENNITKYSMVQYSCEDEYVDSILKKLLKLDEYSNNKGSKKIIIESIDKTINITFYTEEKKESNESISKEIEILKSNIERRSKLLANEGYLNKAPAELIEEEERKLNEEEDRLKKII
jgi:valyl-tRNA synthetase